MNNTDYSITPNGQIREYDIKTGETIKIISNEEYENKLKNIKKGE